MFNNLLDITSVADRPNIYLVERLFASSLVALVSNDHPRKLDVCHFKKGSEICNYSYSNAILAVKLNRMVSTFFFIHMHVHTHIKHTHKHLICFMIIHI